MKASQTKCPNSQVQRRTSRHLKRETQKILNQVVLLARRELQAHTGVIVIHHGIQGREPAIVVEAAFEVLKQSTNWSGPHVTLRNSRLSDTQEVDKRAQIGRKRHNRPDIQVAVGPPVQAMAHATGAGIRLNGAGAQVRQRVIRCL